MGRRKIRVYERRGVCSSPNRRTIWEVRECGIGDPYVISDAGPLILDSSALLAVCRSFVATSYLRCGVVDSGMSFLVVASVSSRSGEFSTSTDYAIPRLARWSDTRRRSPRLMDYRL